MTPTWMKPLTEVLKQPTQSKSLVSAKTGKEYTTDVIPLLKVYSTGSVEEIDGKFKYAIVDAGNNLDYSIKVPNKVEVKFGMILQFTNVRGGATSNGNGWYAADSVAIVTSNGKA